MKHIKFNKLILLCVILIISLNVKGQRAKIQTGYTYQFTKFINWPGSYKSGDFMIGILGDSEMTSFLESLAATKTVVNQKIVIKKYSSVSEIDKCNILIIPLASSDYLSQALLKIGSGSTLVIAEKTGMAQKGAAINFIKQGGKIVFELNKGSISNHNLSVNSQLSNLAIKVY